MTEKELDDYKVIKSRIEHNKKRLKNEKEKEIPVVGGKVKGSSKVFPYLEKSFHVQMHEPKEADIQSKRIKNIEKSISDDLNKIQNIEEFISEIDDPVLQSIFEMRVYDKMNWTEIAAALDEDKDRTTYSKKYKNCLENSHNSPISHSAII